MGTILNQSKEARQTCKQVKEESEKMYTMYDKNGNPGIVDVWASKQVEEDAIKAMGKIEMVQRGLDKNSKVKEEYKREYNEMDKIRKEAKSNCKRK